MPKVILRFVWITGAVLTVGGIVFAAIMARGEERELIYLAPAFTGAILLMCMVFIGLIQDVVTDLITQLRQVDARKKASKADTQGPVKESDIQASESEKPPGQ